MTVNQKPIIAPDLAGQTQAPGKPPQLAAENGPDRATAVVAGQQATGVKLPGP